jgi:hypothetical protein
MKSLLLNPVISFGLFLALYFGFIVIAAKDFRPADLFFPFIVGIPAVVLTVIQICVDIRLTRKAEEADSQEEDFIDIAPDTLDIPPKVARARALRFLCWIVGLYLGIWIVGFKIAGPLFFLFFLRYEARARWLLNIALSGLSIWLIFYYFEHLLSVFWPKPLLDRWIDIPWLF